MNLAGEQANDEVAACQARQNCEELAPRFACQLIGVERLMVVDFARSHRKVNSVTLGVSRHHAFVFACCGENCVSICLWARAGRGSPERPGLMLSLESGGSCTGVAYRIAKRNAAMELDVIWRREMFTGAYRPVWTTARTPTGREPAIAFAANRAHERYVTGLGEAAIARHLATGAGKMGRCSDYLFDTVAHLRQLGIRDRRLEALARRVEKLGTDPI
jgi:cation transport regulator ChaC